MIRVFLILFLLSFFIVNNGLAQTNLIDVPTSDTVTDKHLYFQEQLVIINREVQNSAIFTWGIVDNFEAGFNIRHVTFNTRPRERRVVLDPDKPESDPQLLINAQKVFKLAEWSEMGLGRSDATCHHRAFSTVSASWSSPESSDAAGGWAFPFGPIIEI